MSIEKDVEKLYLGDIEKQKKKLKKKKKKRLLSLLITAVFLIAIFLLMNYLGLGFGGGNGDGGEKEWVASSVAQTSSQVTTTTATSKDYIDIKVAGNTFIYNSQEITVDGFVNMVKLMAENVVVNIKDDNATKNAMDSLVKALNENSREYVIEQVMIETSVADSQADLANGDSSEQSDLM